MPKYRIAEFYKGKFGYNSYFELQRWNEVYKHWYCEKNAILLQFIESECTIKGIDYKSLPTVKIEKRKD